MIERDSYKFSERKSCSVFDKHLGGVRPFVPVTKNNTFGTAYDYFEVSTSCSTRSSQSEKMNNRIYEHVVRPNETPK